ncbi:MAG: TonB-dependent receptor [Saprospiraceae bacterium]
MNNSIGSFAIAAFLIYAAGAFGQNTGDTLKNIDLTEIKIVSKRNEIERLPQVQGTNIWAGKKNEVVNLQTANVNLAENSPRQVFAKVPGIMVWEMDGTGNQVGISSRGLNPHRSWEFNVQQNGDVTNSDLFGYPESHYNPPMEALGHIEIVRGSGALQYGPQFGGMLNYVIKEPDTSRAISFETQQSRGSFGLFSSYNAVGGKVGKVTYYGYYNFRRSDGWRENSDYTFNAWHTSVGYRFSSKVDLKASLSHMAYVNHFAAGLTDAMFAEDPRQSNRGRNYFNPTIYLPALHLKIQASENTLITARASAILGQRNSVQFITLPTVNDTINSETDAYNPRQVDRDYYHSYLAQVKLRHDYPFLRQQSHLSVGLRYGNSRTLRKQKGLGTTTEAFDLSLIAPYRIDLVFKTTNYALFAENAFNFTDRFSVTPGFRFEYVNTDLSGTITGLPPASIPIRLTRKFPLFGLGLEYQVSPLINAYGNFTQNFRPVLHSDLIPATDLDRVNPDLQDARGGNAEIGLRGALGGALRFDLNYFLLRYNDRIGTLIQNDQGSTYFYKTNIGDLTNQGAEVFLEFHPLELASGPASDFNLAVFSSTAYNHGRYTSGTVAVNGENLDIAGKTGENIPTWISRNGITVGYGTFSTTLQLSYVSDSYSDAINTISSSNGVNGIVPSYLITDLNLSYYFLNNYNVKLSIGNLTDRHYYTRRATGYPGPGILPSDGRSLMVSVGARF